MLTLCNMPHCCKCACICVRLCSVRACMLCLLCLLAVPVTANNSRISECTQYSICFLFLLLCLSWVFPYLNLFLSIWMYTQCISGSCYALPPSRLCLLSFTYSDGFGVHLVSLVFITKIPLIQRKKLNILFARVQFHWFLFKQKCGLPTNCWAAKGTSARLQPIRITSTPRID